MNNLLTVEEVKNYLAIEQQQLEHYIAQGKLQAYKIGGTFLRFRKEDVLNLRFEIQPSGERAKKKRPGVFSKIADFWRFNNFYILSLLIVAAAVYFILRA